MDCDVSEEQLWSWVDQNSPELERHLCHCARCRELAARMRDEINALRIEPPPARFPLPERIGSYRVLRLLGEGGQAVVYAAEQQTPRREVALKVLKGGRFVHDHELRHFQREVQTLGTLHHPGIATIYEADRTEEGLHFFAMELVGGLPLGGYVRERRPDTRERLKLFAKICDAVAYAHTRGVIHRDLKPGNIVIDTDGNPHVLDFGLARLTDADLTLTSSVTASGLLVGTLRYMSPEQARGAPSQVDARSDIYALGVILYELLTDKPPYETGPTTTEAVLAICEATPRRPSSICRTLRGDLETIVLKALEKEPARRYASVAALAADVRRYLANEPIEARPASRLYKLRKKVGKHRLTVIVAAAALLIAAAGIWTVRTEYRASNSPLQQDARRHALAVVREIETGPVQMCLPEASAFSNMYRFTPETPLIDAKALFRAWQDQQDNALVMNAIDHLEPSGYAWPAPWANLQLLGELLTISGLDPARGALCVKQAEARMPRTAEGWYLRSLATLAPRRAIEYAQKAVQLDPHHTLAWERLALLYTDRGEEQAARDAAAHVTEIGRGVSCAIEVQAHILLKERRYADAIVAYTDGIAVNPYSSTCYRERALAHLCLRQFEPAVADYGSAIRLSVPHNATWARYHRATALWILGRYSEARADYDHACDENGKPSFADARRFLVQCDQARALARQGQPDEAKALTRQARTALDAARRAAQAGSWVAAVLNCLAGQITPDALIATADATNPEAVCESLYYAGEACLLSGRRAEAREFFVRSVDTKLVFDRQVFPPDPMNEFHLARWRLSVLEGPASRPAPPDG